MFVLDVAFYCEFPTILIGASVKAVVEVGMYFIFNTLTWIIAAEFHSFVT